MLEGLDRVPWGELAGAFGPAADVPDYVRMLASPDAQAREDGRNGLWNVLGHQGTRCAAAPPAVPFLLDLLEDPATPERPLLLRLLIHLAAGYEESHLPLGLDPAAAFAGADDAAVDAGEADWEVEDATWARRAHAAVLAGIDRVRNLLRDPDDAVRMLAIRALAWFPSAAAASAARVREAARRAQDPRELASALLCLGILGRALGDTADAAWLREHLSPGEPYGVRVTAAISLAVILGDALPPEALEALLEAVQDAERAEAEGAGMAWHCSGLVAHAAAALAALALPPSPPVLEALRRAAASVPPMASLQVMELYLRLVFPDREPARVEDDPASPNGIRVLFRDPAGLDERQREAVRAICGSPIWPWKGDAFDAHSELLWSYGLPTRLQELSRMVEDRW